MKKDIFYVLEMFQTPNAPRALVRALNRDDARMKYAEYRGILPESLAVVFIEDFFTNLNKDEEERDIVPLGI